MAHVRAKFKVESVTKRPVYGDMTANLNVVLTPVYGQTGENAIFGKATPSGRIEMHIQQAEAAAVFEAKLGQECYIDFTFPAAGE